MNFDKFKHKIFVNVFLYLYILSSDFTFFDAFNILEDGLLDDKLDDVLDNEVKIDIDKVVDSTSYKVNVYVVDNKSLAKLSFESVDARDFIEKWNVDERVETIKTTKSVIKLLKIIRDVDSEDISFRDYVVYLCRRC